MQKAKRLLSLLSYLVTETSRGANREYSRMIFTTVPIALLYTITLTSPLFFNGTRAFSCRIDETPKTDNHPSPLVGGHEID